MKPFIAKMIKIRKMEAADLASVVAIDEASFAVPWPENAFSYELQENSVSQCWVAEVATADGARGVAAGLVAWVILDEAHIGTLAVHPAFRRQGIARKLLKKSLRALYKRGIKTVMLEVRRSNTAAQKLYAEFGFVIVGERLGYYSNNQEDALLMTLYDLEHWHANNP